MRVDPEVLAAGHAALGRLAEGIYLLGRFTLGRLPGPEGGRQWERWIAHDLLPRGTTVSQGPGALRLFGASSHSGLAHELDGAASGWWGGILLEAKCHDMGELAKSEVLVFDRKSVDLLMARLEAGSRAPHWRVIAATGAVSDALRQYCFLHAIVLVDDVVLPLPLLLDYAASDVANRYGDPMLWRELTTLATDATLAFEERYVPSPEGYLFRRLWTRTSDLPDLAFVQATLSAEVLEGVDVDDPEFFVRRAAQVLRGIDIEREARRLSSSRQ